jgi:hypothetical protein
VYLEFHLGNAASGTCKSTLAMPRQDIQVNAGVCFAAAPFFIVAAHRLG